jgi:hypothetical protein
VNIGSVNLPTILFVNCMFRGKKLQSKTQFTLGSMIHFATCFNLSSDLEKKNYTRGKDKHFLSDCEQ